MKSPLNYHKAQYQLLQAPNPSLYATSHTQTCNGTYGSFVTGDH